MQKDVEGEVSIIDTLDRALLEIDENDPTQSPEEARRKRREELRASWGRTPDALASQRRVDETTGRADR